MDELALVHDAQHGDLDAFNRLVLAYQDMAFNLAYRMLGDDAQAEDATQNAFFSAYRSLATFRGGSFKAWLLRTVTNTCYDELRRRMRHPTTPLEPENDDEEEIENPSWMKDDGLSPEESFERVEMDHAIQHCLEGLPEEFRLVAILVDVQGMDYQEVSDVIGKPLGTVKSRVSRARLRLRGCLEGVWELFADSSRLKDEVSS